MPFIHKELFLLLQKELKANAKSDKAKGMQAYMKSSIPYYGVYTPILKKITRHLYKEIEFRNSAEWTGLVKYIWGNAQFREEKYAALHLLEHKSAKAFQTSKNLNFYKQLIVEGAWWDLVDPIATISLGAVLKNDPLRVKPVLLKWSTSSNMWVRRSAILSQIKLKKETDIDFLEACISPSMASKEFFLRKAIGWALRQYAWTNPSYVKRYVQENALKLSALSQREALKNISK